MTVGDRIREARLEAGLSQRKLEKDLGASQGQISDLEANRRGKNPSATFIAALADVLGVSASWLLTGALPKRPASNDEADQSYVRAKAPPEFEDAARWATEREGVSKAACAIIRPWAQGAPVRLSSAFWLEALRSAELALQEAG